MKNLKLILTVLAISLATTFSVSAEEINPTKQLRSQIVSMLGKQVPLQIEKTDIAEVSFLINNKNEIVIISVSSNFSTFNSFVKNKLNYKKINTKGINRGEIYRMPVRIQAA